VTKETAGGAQKSQCHSSVRGNRRMQSPEGTTESSPGRSPGLTMEQTGQSRKGRLKATYEIQPSLTGLICIVEPTQH
jgi:hypothetical protein